MPGMIGGELMRSGRAARQLKLDTLIRLRWLAIAGQTAAVSLVHFGLGFVLPFSAAFALIGAAAALNLALTLRLPASHRLGETAATWLLGFDIVQLAALLFLTGGLQNPFAILFLAPVLISAAALSPDRTLMLGVLAAGCATFLVFLRRPLPWYPPGSIELPFFYVIGILAAILLGLAFTAVFTWRVAEEAHQLAQALAATELILAREQHLSQLDGLAAAAAHELGTPLNTIALVARDLDSQAPEGTPMKEDTQLLRSQVARCRGILEKLASLGEGIGFLDILTLRHLVAEVVEPHLAFDVPIAVRWEGGRPEPVCRRNPGVLYGLGNLLDNAVDFATSNVIVLATWTDETVAIEIADDGPGFAPEVLLRLGEPYVTTRAGARSGAGEGGEAGLGLGLFIAKTLIERSGAVLTFSNTAAPASGAIARVTWSRAAFEREVPQETAKPVV